MQVEPPAEFLEIAARFKLAPEYLAWMLMCDLCVENPDQLLIVCREVDADDDETN